MRTKILNRLNELRENSPKLFDEIELLADGSTENPDEALNEAYMFASALKDIIKTLERI